MGFLRFPAVLDVFNGKQSGENVSPRTVIQLFIGRHTTGYESPALPLSYITVQRTSSRLGILTERLPSVKTLSAKPRSENLAADI